MPETPETSPAQTPEPLTLEQRAFALVRTLLGHAEDARPSIYAPWREQEVRDLAAPIAAQIREAVLAERAACAAVARTWRRGWRANDETERTQSEHIAAHIEYRPAP